MCRVCKARTELLENTPQRSICHCRGRDRARDSRGATLRGAASVQAAASGGGRDAALSGSTARQYVACVRSATLAGVWCTLQSARSCGLLLGTVKEVFWGH
eukprot:2862452-Pleurochrysis_carterae.AAC.2